MFDNGVLPGFGTVQITCLKLQLNFRRFWKAVRMAERCKAPDSRFVHLPMM